MNFKKLFFSPVKLLISDNLKLGLILGLFLPILGFIGFIKYKLGINVLTKWKEFQEEILQHNHNFLSASLSISLLANALIFTIYVNYYRDKTGKGIFFSTILYGILILLLKAFY
jgi:hypothetical protein